MTPEVAQTKAQLMINDLAPRLKHHGFTWGNSPIDAGCMTELARLKVGGVSHEDIRWMMDLCFRPGL